MRRLVPLLFLLLLGGLVLAKLYVVELVTVSGNDMAPALQRGDRLLVYRLDRTPRRGDLVLAEHPKGSRLLLRRVVGLPGERVAVRGEVPRVDGEGARREAVGEIELSEAVDGSAGNRQLRLVKERLGAASYLVIKDPRRRSRDAPAVELRGAYYLMADHRNHGHDSRTFGPVPAAKIRGKVVARIGAGPGVVRGQPDRPGFFRFE